MNAVNPVQSSIAPGDHPPAAEPSMEEILASIRRIIADDQSFPGRLPTDMATAGIAPETASNASELDPAPVDAESETGDEGMRVLHPPAPDVAAPHEAAPALTSEPLDLGSPEHFVHAPQFASPEGPGLTEPPSTPEVAGAGSIAEELEAALAQTIVPDIGPGEEPVHSPHATGAAPAENLFSPAIDSSVATAFNTLAASRLVASSDELRTIVREMIRPLLKTWIDENLPNVVERLVIAEIERIARGGT